MLRPGTPVPPERLFHTHGDRISRNAKKVQTMADPEKSPLDDLDAFFSAASSSNPMELQQAAQNVTSPVIDAADRRPSAVPQAPKKQTRVFAEEPEPDPYHDDEDDEDVTDTQDFAGKFITIDPASLPDGGAGASDQPFILIPAHIHSFLPWWGWVTIGVGLVMLAAGVLLMPGITLGRLTSRLDDTNQANVQYTMRQLVVQGDERTVGKLYDLAASREAGISTRLKAVDTLGLIPAQHADRALLRLELASETDERVREAAIAARKQREASRTRGGR